MHSRHPFFAGMLSVRFPVCTVAGSPFEPLPERHRGGRMQSLCLAILYQEATCQVAFQTLAAWHQAFRFFAIPVCTVL